MRGEKVLKLRMDEDTHYVWVGGSCDYAHEERAGGGAYIMETCRGVEDRYVTSDFGTTEFRMMLTVMLHAMLKVPEGSDMVFLTNVAYIQNFDKIKEGAANADLIEQCINARQRLRSAKVKIVGYHKYHQLPDTHEMAHRAMTSLRNARP